eukprot:207183-Chlamydomonas_euryale.AAC.4
MPVDTLLRGWGGVPPLAGAPAPDGRDDRLPGGALVGVDEVRLGVAGGAGAQVAAPAGPGWRSWMTGWFGRDGA